ncbi:MAG: hypothetical protein HEEMFOPI_00417 [Holosporales bacterium]
MSLLFLPPLDTLPFKSHPKGVLLYVKATPHASKDAFGKVEQSAYHPVLKIYTRSVAEDGKANKAIVDFLSSYLKIKKNQIILQSGYTDRFKTFLLIDIGIEDLLKKIPL